MIIVLITATDEVRHGMQSKEEKGGRGYKKTWTNLDDNGHHLDGNEQYFEFSSLCVGIPHQPHYAARASEGLKFDNNHYKD